MGGEWKYITVNDIAAPTRNAIVGGPFGSDLVSRDYTATGVPVIRGQNMGARWITGPFVFVSEIKSQSLAANLACPGDIVFTQRGTLGQVSLVPESSYRSYLISQSQMKLTVNPAVADPLFIYYLFISDEQQNYIHQHAIQTGVPHTNLGILRSTPITLPPLDEQRAIAHILGTLDDKIELNRRMSQTLEEMARALFQSWFVDFDPVHAKAEGRWKKGRTLPGMPAEMWDLWPDSFEESELGPIPKGWSVGRLGDVAEIVGGSTPSTKEPAYWEAGVHHWATPKDLSKITAPVLLETERQITDIGLAEISSGLLPVGTVLLSSRAPIGYLAIAETPVAINQGFIAMKPNAGISNIFLWLLVHFSHDAILARANGSTFLEISKANFRPIMASMPPTAVMECFDRLARPWFQRLVRCEKERRDLTQLRDALLPRLISGELRVKKFPPTEGYR
jgi:type I restriction enzyme S subunit